MKGPRLLGTACVGLLAAAAALWGAAQFVWFRVTADVPGGRVVEFTGGQLRPSLGGVALLALAGVAGVLAASGVLRRIVGGLLGLAGAAVAALGVLALVTDPLATDGPLPAPPPGVTADALRYQPTEVTPTPLLAVLGGLALVAVGVVVVVRERRLPRFGARYAAPGKRPPPDPDRAVWQDLDAGRDPTAAEPPERAG